MFYISPLKEEVMYLKPRVVIYRDFLSDVDIAKIRELATPRVKLDKIFVDCTLKLYSMMIVADTEVRVGIRGMVSLHCFCTIGLVREKASSTF